MSCRHLQLGWASVDPTTPIKVGGKFGIVVHEMVAWLVNPLRIAYVSDEQEVTSKSLSANQAVDMPSLKSTSSKVYSFGGGTLQGHLLVSTVHVPCVLTDYFYVTLG